MVIRPKTAASSISKQISSHCPNADIFKTHSQDLTLYHIPCDVVLKTSQWSGGVHFTTTQTHKHPRPHPVHTLLPEKREFNQVVAESPQSKALALILGAPTLNGPGKSVTDISPVYQNAHRVNKEQQKIIRDADPGGEKFIKAYADFDREHPGFIIYSVIGAVTVISVQTQFMRSNLVKDDVLAGPINGIVNNATHSFWKEKNALLMISSCYCPVLFRWVPGIMSYTNGQTEEHFMHHFYALFQSMAIEAEERNIIVEDKIFAGVST